jgi:broad specificity phosphatase PhoE
MITIYLVRHGRTTLNAEGRFRGRLDPPLDSVGLAEAGRAADTLAGINIAAVYSSPLMRATQTAEAIADVVHLEVKAEQGLIDIDYGDWEGLTEEECERLSPEEFARFHNAPFEAQPLNGEPMSEVANRARDALLRLSASDGDTRIVAVSHQVPIRLVVSHLLGIDNSGLWELDLPTGSVSRMLSDGATLRMGEGL